MQRKKTNLSGFDNSQYRPGATLLKRICWYLVNICFFVCPHPFSGVRIFLLRLFGARVGNGVIIKPSVNIKYPWKLTIGNHAWIGEGVWIDNLDKVMIGNHVCISQGAMLLCGNHDYTQSTFDLITGEIVLEEGVWVGAGSIVCPGVICRSHSVLAVGSVASAEMEPYSVYRGNPAIKIRERFVS